MRNIGQRGFELFAALRRLLRRFAQGDGGFVDLVLQARVGGLAVAVKRQIVASAVDGSKVIDQLVQPFALSAPVDREHAKAGSAAEQADSGSRRNDHSAVRLAAFYRPFVLRNAVGAQQLFGVMGVFLRVEELHDLRVGDVRIMCAQVGDQLRNGCVVVLPQVTKRQNGAYDAQHAAGGGDRREEHDEPFFRFHTSSIL